MNIASDPHDRFVRSTMANKLIAKAFFERHLPAKVLSVLNTETLKLEDGTFIDSKLHKSMSDMVFDCCYNDHQAKGNAKVVLLVEHQSTPQKLLPFRVYHYMFNMLQLKLKARSKKSLNEPLPAVYTLVLYNGQQTPYPYSLKLTDCFDDPHQVMVDVFSDKIPLVDINQEKDIELKQLKWFGILSMALKYSRTQDASALLLMLSEIIQSVDMNDPQALDLLKTVINYILVVSNDNNANRIIEHCQHLPEPMRGEIMTVAEVLKAEGKKEGKAEGKAEGIKQTQLEIATTALKEGADPLFVAKVTKLDLLEVEKLKQQLSHSN